ncbi:hypothetical protein GCM10011487_19320 [Steroidobacter agaridevorans]|uniref:Glycosyltransferase RgtA/B/C/D-like domain-containing protein n=1 Tax=Steroidobacter agaridevorans TaxID=2695856 RepID=A0A829YBD9_9GAMM|nr:hypothetical protein [Steroidobacter agaridevorans]GFE79932.1 hypothetical protein GCM10011487_19320 [Steroidobacter agaridevorans]
MQPSNHGSAAVAADKWTIGTFALCTIAALYGLFCLALSNAPLTDLPNHLVRAHAIGDFLFDAGRLFGGSFSFHPRWTPYLAGDLVLACLDWLVGIEWASRLWIAISVLLLPLSIWFVLGVQGCSRRGQIVGSLLGFYLATDWFFASGFLNYRISVACVLFGYGWFLRSQDTGSMSAYVWYILLAVIGYAMHLSALIFLFAVVAVSLAWAVLKGRQPLSRATVLALPLLALLAIHFGFPDGEAGNDFASHWGTWESKLRRLMSSAVRFNVKYEILLFALFLTATLVPWLGIRWRQAFRSSSTELALALVFMALYFALPLVHGGVYDVDNRALPLALLFLLFAGIRSCDLAAPAQQRQLVLAITVAAANLVYLGFEILPQNYAMSLYRTVAQRAPAASAVLPINTQPEIGRYEPFSHAGAFVTSETIALTPYLFSGPANPNIGYFRYLRPPYAPSQFWYTRNDGTVDWEKIKQSYDYLLVTMPYEPSRIGIGFTVMEHNAVASLLKIRK